VRASVLLVIPDLRIPGGVSEFNNLLLKHSEISISTFILSGAGKKVSGFKKTILFAYDIFRFLYHILLFSGSVVHLGPSLGINALRRDSVFCWIAKAARKYVFVQWHGWNPINEKILSGRRLRFIDKTLFRADHIRFLSPSFERFIKGKGFKNRTSVGNTFVDDDIFNNKCVRKPKESIEILFLSTVSRNKGIFIVLELFQRLKSVHSKLLLTIAGDGPELNSVKTEIQQKGLKDIEFVGHVSGDFKRTVFQKADLYLFPSFYEGMPLSVLEAMSFSLPIICSSVGAISDFFIDGEMGFIIKDQNMEAYYEALEFLITNSVFRIEMGEFNYLYAKENFAASKNVRKITEEYLSLMRE